MVLTVLPLMLLLLQLLLMLIQMLLQLFSHQVIAPRLLKLKVGCINHNHVTAVHFAMWSHVV